MENVESIQPLRDYILCKIVVEATKAGIILSDEAKANASHKYLFACKLGPDVKSVHIDDKLMVHPLEVMSEKISVDEEHWLIPESAVVAVTH